MLTYPNLDVILFGDSGQSDPQIYYDISNEFPERIKAVVIRRIKNDRSQFLSHAKVPFYYFKNTEDAAKRLEHLRLF